MQLIVNVNIVHVTFHDLLTSILDYCMFESYSAAWYDTLDCSVK